MTKDSSGDAKKRQRYHHGDVRRDLLRVARGQIAQHGAQAVSMTSLAQLIGVSQPALYRHFADRDALLEAVATEAFVDFANRLSTAVSNQTPSDALKAISLAYVAFGEANIEIYRLMFASRLTPQAESSSDLNKASGKAFDRLLTTMSAISPAKTVKDDAYLLWAQLHGLVMLKADGFIVRPLKQFIGLHSAAGGASPAAAKTLLRGR